MSTAPIFHFVYELLAIMIYNFHIPSDFYMFSVADI